MGGCSRNVAVKVLVIAVGYAGRAGRLAHIRTMRKVLNRAGAGGAAARASTHVPRAAKACILVTRASSGCMGWTCDSARPLGRNIGYVRTAWRPLLKQYATVALGRAGALCMHQ